LALLTSRFGWLNGILFPAPPRLGNDRLKI
jgi:hypothetical protein